jgi:hypothetical protein
MTKAFFGPSKGTIPSYEVTQKLEPILRQYYTRDETRTEFLVI